MAKVETTRLRGRVASGASSPDASKGPFSEDEDMVMVNGGEIMTYEIDGE